MEDWREDAREGEDELQTGDFHEGGVLGR
jgi:hypothetical protein